MLNHGFSKVLTIVPSYNGEATLRQCIKSVINESDVLVIDNASTDEGLLNLENEFEKVIVIKNEKNLGFGKAINKGFKYGIENNYSLILIINQDAELMPGAMQGLVKFAEQMDLTEWAIISPWNFNSTGKETEYYFENNLKRNSGMLRELLIHGNQVRQVDFINAACWLINPKALSKLMGFDERFFMYGEDLDFCNRAKYLGYKIYVMKDIACIHHKRKGDYERNPKKQFGLTLGSEMAYYFDPASSLLSKIGHFIRGFLVCIKLLINGRFSHCWQRLGVIYLLCAKYFASDFNKEKSNFWLTTGYEK